VLIEGETDEPDVCEGTYFGSSGYQRIPGDTCAGGLSLDSRVLKNCSSAPGDNLPIKHYLVRTFFFPLAFVIPEHNVFFFFFLLLWPECLWQ